MGFSHLGNFNTLNAAPVDDSALGTQVAQTLHQQMRNYGYKGSYNDLMNAMAISPSTKTYLAKLIPIHIDGWGFQARIGNLNAAKIQEAMKTLASKSRGVPPTAQAVTQALGQRAMQFDWSEAIKFTAVESAKQITKGAQEVGKSVITAGKVMNFLIPAIPIVLLLAVYMGTKGRLQGMQMPRLPKRLGGK